MYIVYTTFTITARPIESIDLCENMENYGQSIFNDPNRDIVDIVYVCMYAVSAQATAPLVMNRKPKICSLLINPKYKTHYTHYYVVRNIYQ